MRLRRQREEEHASRQQELQRRLDQRSAEASQRKGLCDMYESQLHKLQLTTDVQLVTLQEQAELRMQACEQRCAARHLANCCWDCES